MDPRSNIMGRSKSPRNNDNERTLHQNMMLLEGPPINLGGLLFAFFNSTKFYNELFMNFGP